MYTNLADNIMLIIYIIKLKRTKTLFSKEENVLVLMKYQNLFI